MNGEILKKHGKPKAYTVKLNGSKFPAYRISLHPDCGFIDGDKVYEYLLPDGSLLLVPAEKVDLSEYQ